MEQAAVKRKTVIVPFLIGLLLLSSIVFIKHLMNRMNSYIEKNGKMSMGAVVEQMQQTYELQTNGYYSQLHLVEGYLLQKKELSLETEENRNFFEIVVAVLIYIGQKTTSLKLLILYRTFTFKSINYRLLLEKNRN